MRFWTSPDFLHILKARGFRRSWSLSLKRTLGSHRVCKNIGTNFRPTHRKAVCKAWTQACSKRGPKGVVKVLTSFNLTLAYPYHLHTISIITISIHLPDFCNVPSVLCWIPLPQTPNPWHLLDPCIVLRRVFRRCAKAQAGHRPLPYSQSNIKCSCKKQKRSCVQSFFLRITNRTELSDTVWHSVDGLEWWRKDIKASSWKFDKLGKLKNSKTHRTCEQLQNDIAATKQYFILLLVPDYHTNHLIHDSESLSILSMQWPFFERHLLPRRTGWANRPGYSHHDMVKLDKFHLTSDKLWRKYPKNHMNCLYISAFCWLDS